MEGGIPGRALEKVSEQAIGRSEEVGRVQCRNNQKSKTCQHAKCCRLAMRRLKNGHWIC